MNSLEYYSKLLISLSIISADLDLNHADSVNKFHFVQWKDFNTMKTERLIKTFQVYGNSHEKNTELSSQEKS